MVSVEGDVISFSVYIWGARNADLNLYIINIAVLVSTPISHQNDESEAVLANVNSHLQYFQDNEYIWNFIRGHVLIGEANG